MICAPAAELSVGEEKRETRAVASYSPTFREGFTILLGGALEKDTLKIKVSGLLVQVARMLQASCGRRGEQQQEQSSLKLVMA